MYAIDVSRCMNYVYTQVLCFLSQSVQGRVLLILPRLLSLCLVLFSVPFEVNVNCITVWFITLKKKTMTTSKIMGAWQVVVVVAVRKRCM